MARHPPPARGDRLFLIVLLVLALLALELWVADPSHAPDGNSRAEWPLPDNRQP